MDYQPQDTILGAPIAPGNRLVDERQPETQKVIVDLRNELEMLTNNINQLRGRLVPVMRDQDMVASEQKMVEHEKPYYSSQLAKMLGDEVYIVKQARITIDMILVELEV